MNESAVYKKLKDEIDKVAKIKLIITTDDFSGDAVTVSHNDILYIKQGTFDESGHFECYLEHVGVYTIECNDKSTTIEIDGVGKVFNAKINDSVVYGFVVSGSESSPSANITYIEEAVGMQPAKMNFTSGSFDWGDWGDAFFIPRPCLLNANGTVFKYLNPNDYTKDVDGNDVSSYLTGASGSYNAMMEWGKDHCQIWSKIVPDQAGTGATVYISDAQQDEDYHAWSFYGQDGELKEHFYTPIYNGVNMSSKLRSVSGKSILNNVAGTTEIQYAVANGNGWYIETYADRVLINLLLMLIGKSTNMQATFGNGHYTGGSAAGNLLQTGTMNTRGLFWGTNGTGSGVKVFGMENYWGNQWRRTAGLVNANGTQKYKLTYGTEDGTTANGYNTDGNGYKVASDCTPGGTSGGYLNVMKWFADGFFGKTASGSETTYWCDGMWFNNSQNDYALFGGSCCNGFGCGAFCVHLGSTVSIANWYYGAAPSYHG